VKLAPPIIGDRKKPHHLTVWLLVPRPALGWASLLKQAADFPEGYKNLIILKTLTSVRFVVLAYKYWLEISQQLSTR